MRQFLRTIVMTLMSLLAFASAANAQAQGMTWTGTWTSQHGDLRLIQEGSRVYGDYAERGYFEGRVSADGMRLRGTFQYNSPRSSNGYIEFQRSGDSFTGGWSWARSGPVDAAKGNWKGSLKSAATPQLKSAVGRDQYWADFWAEAGSAARDWSFAGVPDEADKSFVYGGVPTAEEEDKSFVYEGVPANEEDKSFTYETAPASGEEDRAFAYETAPAGPWTGTFSTIHGDIRLIQIGDRVFGDYAARGYFEGCVRNGGQTLRGTFQYLSPRSKHGFIEFRLNGDSFEGTWTWTRDGVPRFGNAINWRGTRESGDAPALTHVNPDQLNFADIWRTLPENRRAWVLGQQGVDQCATAGL